MMNETQIVFRSSFIVPTSSFLSLASGAARAASLISVVE
jgi:hypothetical protein